MFVRPVTMSSAHTYTRREEIHFDDLANDFLNAILYRTFFRVCFKEIDTELFRQFFVRLPYGLCVSRRRVVQNVYALRFAFGYEKSKPTHTHADIN